MNRYFLLIAYDGSNYSGWQSQVNAQSIQATLEAVITKILQREVAIIGSGRTDAKAHALGQVAHFDTEKKIDEKTFLISLNSLLPNDIRVLDIQPTSKDFHSRFSAVKKIYHYYINQKTVVLPHLRTTHLHINKLIDLKLIQKAADEFIGTYDFTSFANVGSSVKSMTKTIYKIECSETPVGLCLEFEGSGFLYKMVRNIVGTLLAVDKGTINSDQIKSILSAKDRRCAFNAAPAHGLFLMRVEYPKQFDYLFSSEKTKPRLQTLELVTLD